MTEVALCDFVHDHSKIGTYTFPLNIGFLATYAKQYNPEVSFKLFKYAENFVNYLQSNNPDIVGFGTYAWNNKINQRMAQLVKTKNPKTITVFGGPNIDYTPQGTKSFFKECPDADTYITYEGEKPFNILLTKYLDRSLELRKVITIPGINDVNEIPSPYLTGLFDPYFDTRLIPIIETNRGCPYRCTYCCQGKASHHHVKYYNIERIKAELKYIAQRVKNTNILLLADANFGINQRDLEIVEYLKELKEKYDYPRKIGMNWAKNQPKLFDIAKTLDMSETVISLQSLDEQVLKNIKRNNIDINIFKDIIKKVNESKGTSGTEIILGLPGETKESHINTLKQLFDWQVSYIVCYNCLILKGSELSEQRETGEFKCKTKFRLIDNAYGLYNNQHIFETEEGIRETDTISEEEILFFRPVHWLIQFLWNYKFYYELLTYLKDKGTNPYDFISYLVTHSKQSKSWRLFMDFQREAYNEWFDTPQKLEEYYTDNFFNLKEFGKMNAKYIFKTITESKEAFENYLLDSAHQFNDNPKQLEEIMTYLSSRIINFNLEDFDEKQLFYNNHRINLYVPNEQQESIKKLLKQYEHADRIATLRKMSEYMDIKDFFYKVKG